MKLLKEAGSHRILGIMGQNDLNTTAPLQLIEEAGRTAYQSRDKITSDSAEKFVEMLRERGHESVLEHSSMTVEFNDVCRGFTHELVRHRLMAITQESTRYVDESDFKVVIPPERDETETVILTLPMQIGGGPQTIAVTFRDWMEMNENMYRKLRKKGWPAQDARQVLPIGIKSQIVVTANFREWRHIFKMRTAAAAHWEIRRVMMNLLEDVRGRIPVVFDDIGRCE